jgi:hypothetical protein
MAATKSIKACAGPRSTSARKQRAGWDQRVVAGLATAGRRAKSKPDAANRLKPGRSGPLGWAHKRRARFRAPMRRARRGSGLTPLREEGR